jgi:hypothetical protein
LLDWPPSLAEDEQAKIHTAEESNAKEMVDEVIESANSENHLVQLMSHLDWHVIEILMFRFVRAFCNDFAYHGFIWMVFDAAYNQCSCK